MHARCKRHVVVELHLTAGCDSAALHNAVQAIARCESLKAYEALILLERWST